jgi:hypothetical protein
MPCAHCGPRPRLAPARPKASPCPRRAQRSQYPAHYSQYPAHYHSIPAQYSQSYYSTMPYSQCPDALIVPRPVPAAPCPLHPTLHLQAQADIARLTDSLAAAESACAYLCIIIHYYRAPFTERYTRHGLAALKLGFPCCSLLPRRRRPSQRRSSAPGRRSHSPGPARVGPAWRALRRDAAARRTSARCKPGSAAPGFTR